MTWRIGLLYLLVGIVLTVFLPWQGEAKPFEEQSLPAKSGLVVSSAFLSTPYFASKMIYATCGSIVAGGINVFSLGFAQDTATTVGCQAVNGDWIVYPTVLTQERSLEFIGKDEPVEGSTLTMNQDKEVD